LELVKALGCPVVKGNHDLYAATDISLKEFTLPAMNALIWTRGQLSPEERSWLNSLPMQADFFTTEETEEYGGGFSENSVPSSEAGGEKLHLVHSSVFEPEKWRYVIKQNEAEKVLPQQRQERVFFGHTHVAAVYAFDPNLGTFRSTVPQMEGVTFLEAGLKWLINPGSVGQPRDRDPRAAYLIYDPVACTVEHCRVEYDFRKTARKIVEAELPESNAQRLYKGR
jgi:diadenosine tetraphosphatase ApaH/serine/threonine PP2A family protein phosphatase